jgi:hypothetical protein
LRVQIGLCPRHEGLAISEPGIMNEREFDLLTTAPAPTPEEAGKLKGSAGEADSFQANRTTIRLRAIARAPKEIQTL